MNTEHIPGEGGGVGREGERGTRDGVGGVGREGQEMEWRGGGERDKRWSGRGGRGTRDGVGGEGREGQEMEWKGWEVIPEVQLTPASLLW